VLEKLLNHFYSSNFTSWTWDRNWHKLFDKVHYHNSPKTRPLYTLPSCYTRIARGPRIFYGRSVEVSIHCSFPGQHRVNFIIIVITKSVFFSPDIAKFAIFKSQNVIFIVLITMFFTELHIFQNFLL
jgi:hypothetical protein